jgi:hypothetical protein
MKTESSTTPKYRDLSQPGDDVMLVLPQCLYTMCRHLQARGWSDDALEQQTQSPRLGG